MVDPFSQVLRHYLQTRCGSFKVVAMDDIKNLRPGDVVSVWKIAYRVDPYWSRGLDYKYREMDSGEMPWIIL